MNLDVLRTTFLETIADASEDQLLELAGVLEIARLQIQRRLAPAAAPAAPPRGQHLTVEEIARRLGFEVPYTYALARQGKFGPVLHEGKYVRVPEAGFDAYLRRAQESAYISGRRGRQ